MKRKKLNKRVLALFMTIMMCMSVFQISAFASEMEESAAQSLRTVQDAVDDDFPDTNNQEIQTAAKQDLTESHKTETKDIPENRLENDASKDQVLSVSLIKAPEKDSASSGEPKVPGSLNSVKPEITDDLTNPGEPERSENPKEQAVIGENSGSPGEPELPEDQQNEETGDQADSDKSVNETENDETKDPADTEKTDGITENPAEKPTDTITETPKEPEIQVPSQEQNPEQAPVKAPDESVKEAEAKVEAAEKESAEADEKLRTAKEAADKAAAKLETAGEEAERAAADLEKAEAEAAQAETEEEKAQAAEKLSAAKAAADAAAEKLSAADAESAEALRALQEAGEEAQAAAEKLADAKKAADDIKAKLDAANKDDSNSPSGGGGGGSAAPKPEEIEKPEKSEVSENVKAFINMAAELSANLTKENAESARADLAAAYAELSEEDQASEEAKTAMAELESLIKALEEPEEIDFTAVINEFALGAQSVYEKLSALDLEIITQEQYDEIQTEMLRLQELIEAVPDELLKDEIFQAAYNQLGMAWQILEGIDINLLAEKSTWNSVKSDLEAGKNVTLNHDITGNTTINITANVVLDLAGFNVNYNGASGSIFHVTNGTFTLKDSSGNNSGKLTGGKGTKVKWNQIVERDKINGEAAGGAVLVESGAKFIMNGGTIGGSKSECNSAIWGGGIAVARGGFLEIYGGNITWNKATGIIYGDTIGGGGGIFCAGTGIIDPQNGDITIEHNSTGTKNDLGGGGIFVESKGSMKIVNAIITDNTAEGLGGGVAGCLHGMISNLCPETAAIYWNTANKNAALNSVVDHGNPMLNWSDDLKNNANDYFCAGYSVIGPRSLNGGTAEWTGGAVYQKWNGQGKGDTKKFEKTTNTIVVKGLLGLRVENTDAIKEKADAFSGKKVNINFNSSAMHGGGVASNGILTFGEESFSYSNSKIALNAAKNVINNINTSELKNDYNFQLLKDNRVLGTATSDSNGNIKFDNLDTSVLFGNTAKSGPISATLTLKEIAGNKPGMTYDTEDRKITINAERSQKGEIKVSTGSNGNTVTTYVFEDEISSVIVKIDDKEIANGATYNGNVITLKDNANFTNTMNYGDLKITKNVIGNTLDSSDPKSFEFTVELSSKINGTYTTDKVNKNVTFTNGKSDVINLADNESITIYNLPADVTYTVTEKKYNNYTTGITVNGTNAGNAAGTIDKDITANVVFTNNRNMSNLSVTKTVEWDPVTSENPDNDTFQIVVTLGNSNEPVKDVEASDANISIPFEKEGIYTFHLKDGQTAEITRIPVGAEYTVTEHTTELSDYWNKDNNKAPKVKDANNNKVIEKDIDNTVTITNHYFKQKTTNVTVKKEWNKDEYVKMPDSVTVQLLRDGESIKLENGGNDPEYIRELTANSWSTYWNELPVSAGEKSPLYTYTVKEISVNYPEAENGKYTADARLTDEYGKFTSNIIRIRSDIAAEDGSGNEIVGGWIVSDTDLIDNNKKDNEVTITNTWRPAAELGDTSFAVHKIDSETAEAIEGVTFTLKKDGEVIDIQTTAKSIESGDDTDENSNDVDNDSPKTDKDGLVIFEGLTEGNYTLTEIKAPEAYDIEFDSEKNPNGNTGRTWEISIQKDGLASVQEISDSENIVGENTWNWKPVHEDMALNMVNHTGVLTVTNNVVKGNISIKKEINLLDLEGNHQDIDGNVLASDLKDKTFTFNLYEGENINIPEDGTIAEPLKTLSIKAGETAQFSDLRYGTYTIVEADPDNSINYKWTKVDYAGSAAEDSETAYPIKDTVSNGIVVKVEKNGVTLSYTATNTYNLVPGSLVINKQVEGGPDFAKTDRVYRFIVTGPNGYINENVTIAGESSSEILTGLVPGEYTITEDPESAEIDGYAWSAVDQKVIVESGLIAEAPAEVSFKNNYTVNSLSIVKIVDGTNAEMFSENTFYVDIINTETGDIVRENVAVAGNGEATTVTELHAGNYKVVERNASQRGYRWSVTYANSQNNEAGDVVTIVDGGNASMTITNTYRRIPSDDPEPPTPPTTPENPPEDPTPVDVPDPETPLVDVPEPDVPLANISEEDTPLSELPEPDVPLANIPDEETPLVELPEDIPLAAMPPEEVPLANIIDEDVPKTGDLSHMVLWIMLCSLALSGITASSVPYLRKRRK